MNNNISFEALRRKHPELASITKRNFLNDKELQSKYLGHSIKEEEDNLEDNSLYSEESFWAPSSEGNIQTTQNNTQPQGNEMAYGGNSNDFSNNNGLVQFDGGGTHEQNSLGGIPIGGNNSVEANETKYTFDDGDYIFSNRISTSGEFHDASQAAQGLSFGGKKFAQGGGLSSSDRGSDKKPYPSVDKSDFAGGDRSYPIPTINDAVDALRLAGLHGRSDVRSKVFAKYPSLKHANGGEIDPPVTDPNDRYKDIRQWTLDYINSPKYRERLTKSGYRDVDREIRKRAEDVQDVNVVDRESRFGTSYIPDRNRIEVAPKMDMALYEPFGLLGVSPPVTESLIAHEMSHAENRGKKMNEYDLNQLRRRLTKESHEPRTVEMRGRKIRLNPWHDEMPSENKADLNAIRYEMKQQGIYDAGTEDLKEEQLDKLQNSGIKDRLMRNYKKEDLMWLINNIAATRGKTADSNVAAYGGKMKRYANGGPVDPTKPTPTPPKTREEAIAALKAKNQAYFETTRTSPEQYNLTRADLFPESEGARQADIAARNVTRTANQASGQARMKQQSENTMRAKGIDPNDPEAVKGYWDAVAKEKKKKDVTPSWIKYGNVWDEITGATTSGGGSGLILGCSPGKRAMAYGGKKDSLMSKIKRK